MEHGYLAIPALGDDREQLSLAFPTDPVRWCSAVVV